MSLLYTTSATATGGRTGRASVDDGSFRFRSSPRGNSAVPVARARIRNSSLHAATLRAFSAHCVSSLAAAS